MSVSFRDGAVHSRGQAKVIGIDDQTPHRDSLAGCGKTPVFADYLPQRLRPTMILDESEIRTSVYLCVGRGAQLMIGLAPDNRDLLVDPEVRRLKEFGEVLHSIYAPEQKSRCSRHQFLRISCDSRFRSGHDAVAVGRDLTSQQSTSRALTISPSERTRGVLGRCNNSGWVSFSRSFTIFAFAYFLPYHLDTHCLKKPCQHPRKRREPR